jgi:ketosteroid isomerase-like protein
MRKLVLTLALLAASCASVPSGDPVAGVNAVLDDWHKAASAADESRYFGHMTADSVYMGTDATERWDVAAFRAYAHPHFAAGKGWTFVPRSRNVIVSPGGDVAWFDEVLDSASYGECRGTGVLRRVDGAWKIAHYNLTIPIPNDLAKDFVARIRAGVPAATPK